MSIKEGELNRRSGSFTWEEREIIIKEYLRGGFTQAQIWKKYTGHDREHGKIASWMRTLGYLAASTPAVRQTVVTVPKQLIPYLLAKVDKDTDPKELLKRIEELQKELELSRLKAEGYELMIEIAEKELNIPIRKKSDTK